MKDSLDALSEPKKKKLNELRRSVEDVLEPVHDDLDLLRWLTAKSFNVKEAERAFRLDTYSKQILGINTILTAFVPNEILQKHLSTGFLGFDYEGHPVRYFNLGCSDMKGMVESVSTLDILRHSMWILETDIDLMKRENEKTGRSNTQIVYICDYETFTMGQILHRSVIEMTIIGLKLYQNHYPERAKCFYIIKAPIYFTVAYNMFKGFIFESMRQTFRIYGKDNWLEDLSQIMDLSILPASLGGTRTDPDGDPKCFSVICYGGQVPSSYHFAPDTWLKPEDPGVISLTVLRRAYHDIKLVVPEKDSSIRWHVQSSDHDVELVAFYKKFSDNDTDQKDVDDMSDFEQLMPTVKIHCHLVPEIGGCICPYKGIYILRFNNVYSWFNDKHLMYKFELIPPSTQN